jgi:hypothetical protein
MAGHYHVAHGEVQLEFIQRDEARDESVFGVHPSLGNGAGSHALGFRVRVSSEIRSASAHSACGIAKGRNLLGSGSQARIGCRDALHAHLDGDDSRKGRCKAH